jgi:hypothetical protein
MTKILIGCDPEVFVKQNNVFKSAFGLIKGDKKNPQRVPHGAVQVDGMALEFNIDPAATEDEFCINVQEVYRQLALMVPDYQIVASPTADFDPIYMKDQPPEALELGCDPDYNGWTGQVNIKPNGDRPMRTASGHIHIGWTDNEDIQSENHVNRCNLVVKQMDFFLGLPSLMYDKDTKRREMYGKSGCCRYKPYGVEYRTLSNQWLNSEALTRWVYRAANKGVKELMNGNNLVKKYGDIQSIINDSNLKEAKKIIVRENLEVCYG